MDLGLETWDWGVGNDDEEWRMIEKAGLFQMGLWDFPRR